jgi:hypothetical protein
LNRDTPPVLKENDMLDLVAIARAKFLSSRQEGNFVPKYRYGHDSYQDVLQALSQNRNANAQLAVVKS